MGPPDIREGLCAPASGSQYVSSPERYSGQAARVIRGPDQRHKPGSIISFAGSTLSE